MNPKTEGVFAFHANRPESLVPYTDKLRRAAWVNGWHQAARAAARKDIAEPPVPPPGPKTP